MQSGPRHNISATVTIDGLVSGLDDVERWMRTLGVTPKGRIAAYRRELLRATGTPLAQHDLSMLNAIFEVQELMKIANLPTDILARPRQLKRLKAITKGDAFYTALKDDTARRFAFELAVAQLFWSCGIRPELEAPADVNIQVGEWKLHIECKRPDVGPSIERNLSDGFRWLRRYAGPNVIGIVAIDVTKALNADFAMAANTTMGESRAAIQAASAAIVRRYQRPSHDIRELGFKDAVHAIIFRLSVVAMCDTPLPRLEVGTEWAIATFGDGMAPWAVELSKALALPSA